MNRSLFRKWLAASVAITFAVLLVLTTAISYLVQRDYDRQGFRQLNDRAGEIEQAYGEFQQGQLTAAEFRKQLRSIAKEGSMSVSVIGKNLTIQKQGLLDLGVKPDLKGWVVQVREGSRIERIAKFRSQDDEKMLIVGFPLWKDRQAAASVFLYKPVADVRQLAVPIRRSIWLVALACAGPLIALLWVAVRRLAKPIMRMDEAAAAIAAGDFSSRVDVRGEDEIARLGRSFNAMAERIERVEEQRRRLLMEFSHELRTPLTSIRGTLQAFSDGILAGEERKEFADLSLTEAERLGRLIDQIQELSAFEEHQVTFDFVTADVSALVEQTVLQMKIKAEEAGMQLTTEGERGLYAKADPARLRQVLVNLVGNAIDHNEPGTEIAVRLRRHANRIQLTVADNGRGIAPEHVPHLFERLYKAESSRATRGSGLGLAIARHIVLAHGGTIRVFSEPGRGTELRVELPLARPGS